MNKPNLLTKFPKGWIMVAYIIIHGVRALKATRSVIESMLTVLRF